MNFDSIKEVKKRELEAIGIIGIDDEGNFEFSDSILDDDMEDIEEQGKKILKVSKTVSRKSHTTKEKKSRKSPAKISEPIAQAPRKYTIQFNKNENEEAELAFATLSSLGEEVEIKDIFNFIMTRGFSADEKFQIQKIASSRILEEKLNKYLKENKLKMDREEVLLHLLNEKIQ
ncbi:hypothetical protein BMS_2297 [Halobacteriovorax marinus SJ]|uniref:Uncharacterized protein n=1 Tax=Halobacteriovorax marinus (strain ATCC BAA-682 / DSM 15412 / SJ) TaxID=862908 RepID=E1X4C5_HALMS|nr:hypothetical protein [Halobacteriovorax marinus]CBW27097.1 hypothetical protein BMS_2297 [Halobacteriovorax marinus SJ]